METTGFNHAFQDVTDKLCVDSKDGGAEWEGRAPASPKSFALIPNTGRIFKQENAEGAEEL
jgi:hypothetical protein